MVDRPSTPQPPSFIGSGVGGAAPLCLSNWNVTTFEKLIIGSDVEDSLYTYEQCRCLDNYVDRLQELFR
jgi:hypothetical protein